MSRVGKNVVTFADGKALSDGNERIQTLYFNWLCVLVHADDYMGHEWYILAKTLHDIEFYWTVPNDDNRASDGVKLRSVWLESLKNESEDLGLSVYVPDDALNGPCTMFEMLVGLAVRIESDIMQNDNEGNRTWIWFWTMINNLLSEHNDDGWWHTRYNDEAISSDSVIREMVRRCLDREYAPDGFGGCLFPLTNAKDGYDRREVEIWRQAQEWVCENFQDELN